jgi:hypothetical protein
LNSFISERDKQQQLFEQLRAAAEREREDKGKLITMDVFEEDWQHSQVGGSECGGFAVVAQPTAKGRTNVELKYDSSSGTSPLRQKLWRRKF